MWPIIDDINISNRHLQKFFEYCYSGSEPDNTFRNTVITILATELMTFYQILSLALC